jgi:FkbM family methyltransferase
MTRLIRNARTLLSNPTIAWEYLYYWVSRLTNSGQAVRSFPGGIRITELCNFSEFHSIGEFISKQEREFLLKYPIGPGAIIDVGANLGLVSIVLARRFPERTVHSFEPGPSTFKALKANIKLNSCANILPLQSAVAEHNDEIPFDANPLGRGTASIASHNGQFVTRVPCTTLDTYAERLAAETIAFLKVDVEGFEAAVFQGARRILSEHRAAIIYYEVCPANSEKSGSPPELPTQILQEHGYQISKVDERGMLKSVDISEVSKTVLDNWVALRP